MSTSSAEIHSGRLAIEAKVEKENYVNGEGDGEQPSMAVTREKD